MGKRPKEMLLRINDKARREIERIKSYGPHLR
jgi:hypothetical protein